MAQRQRKGTPASGGGSNKAFYIVLAVIALGGIVALGYAIGGGNGQAATEMVDLENADDIQALYARATPEVMGPDEAPVRVVEFGDFQCPGCMSFALGSKQAIKPYIDRGQVQFVFYDFPLGGSHVHSFLAARAARCGSDQGQYWEMHDKLFREQGNWTYKQNVVSDFVGYAEEIGLDRGAFESCLKSDKYADVVTANRLLGEQLPVTQTPTVLVNNRRVSDFGPQGLTREVERALAAAGAASQPDTTGAGSGG